MIMNTVLGSDAHALAAQLLARRFRLFQLSIQSLHLICSLPELCLHKLRFHCMKSTPTLHLIIRDPTDGSVTTELPWYDCDCDRDSDQQINDDADATVLTVHLPKTVILFSRQLRRKLRFPRGRDRSQTRLLFANAGYPRAFEIGRRIGVPLAEPRRDSGALHDLLNFVEVQEAAWPLTVARPTI